MSFMSASVPDIPSTPQVEAVVPALCELAAILSVVMLKKRRW